MRLHEFAVLLIRCAEKYPDMDVQTAEITVDNNEDDRRWLTLSYDETYSGYTGLSVTKNQSPINIDAISLDEETDA